MDVAQSVLLRFLEAKGKGMSLMPKYHEALLKVKAGDIDAATTFAEELSELILPGGQRPDWFTGLSVQKSNSINALYNNARSIASTKGGDIKRPEEWARYLALQMGAWEKHIRTLELASVIGDQAQEIAHGQFTVIPDAGLTKKQIDGALAALDAAADKVRSKFPQLLYGKVFLTKHLSKKAVAWYSSSSDTLAINVKAQKRFSDIFTLIHELGHRHDFKFLSKASKDAYWGLSTRKVYEVIEFDAKLRKQVADEAVSLGKLKAQGRPVPGMSELLALWLKSPHPIGDIPKVMAKFLNLQITEDDLHKAVMGKGDAKMTTNKVLHGPLHVTPYGATKPAENYADGFAHFCLGMDMPAELAEILAKESK